MDILYLGEINVQNDIFDNSVDKELYKGVCNKISEKLLENIEFDITTLTLKDLSN